MIEIECRNGKLFMRKRSIDDVAWSLLGNYTTNPTEDNYRKIINFLEQYGNSIRAQSAYLKTLHDARGG